MIFIVIAVFNRKQLTLNCLSSLQKQTFGDFKTIVVDDNSSDGTADAIRKHFPDIHIVMGDGNLWWAGGTNAGIEYVMNKLNPSKDDFILTLNNDLEVGEDYLEIMHGHASSNTNWMLGSVSVDIDDTRLLSFCGVSWNEITGRYHSKAKDYNYSYPELLRKSQFIRSDVLPGRGTLIPMAVFDKIGLFDSKRFPQYAADEDFSLHARRSGWQLVIPTDLYLKSHITATGVDVGKARFSLKFYKQLFFSIKSPLDLKTRYRWAMKNTPLKFLYFLLDCARITSPIVLRSFRNLFKANT
ncbi:MAG TPA: glycosyltransferase family 2 protein [Chitinophagaceae bacterium]|nr:glycosyltransferase family 2 protein [Chitinophagaceae bacterium]